MRIKLTCKCHSRLILNRYYITDVFSVNHLGIQIRNSNFPSHVEKIIAFSPKCSQLPTGWQGLYFFEGFWVVFLPQTLWPGSGSSSHCSAHGVQTIDHSRLAAYNVTVVTQRWLIAGCHPRSLQQHFIIHVGKSLKAGERSYHFSWKSEHTTPKRMYLHPCVLLVLNLQSILPQYFQILKPTDPWLLPALVKHTKSYSSACFFPPKWRHLKIN